MWYFIFSIPDFGFSKILSGKELRLDKWNPSASRTVSTCYAPFFLSAFLRDLWFLKNITSVIFCVKSFPRTDIFERAQLKAEPLALKTATLLLRTSVSMKRIIDVVLRCKENASQQRKQIHFFKASLVFILSPTPVRSKRTAQILQRNQTFLDES